MTGFPFHTRINEVSYERLGKVRMEHIAGLFTTVLVDEGLSCAVYVKAVLLG